jgi:DNA-binding transcriptional MerR regulator
MSLNIHELSKALDVSTDDLNEWLKYDLLTLENGKEDNFNSIAIDEGKGIKKFIELGYQLKDIKKIHKNVGLPNIKETKEYKNHGNLLTVGELAEKSNLNRRTIKFWEEKGLIKPFKRTEGGFRLFRKDDTELLIFIKDLQAFNYTLSEIGNILKLVKGEFDREDKSLKEMKFEELEKNMYSLQYLLERMAEIREATLRAENIFNKRLKKILKYYKNLQKSKD